MGVSKVVRESTFGFGSLKPLFQLHAPITNPVAGEPSGRVRVAGKGESVHGAESLFFARIGQP
jgi:hypothetical protein